MSNLFAIEPIEPWRSGDRAYCIRPYKERGKHILERGRIYVVSAATQYRALANSGLELEGVDIGQHQFSSSRFVCIRQRGRSMAAIHDATRHKWLEAYWATQLHINLRRCANAPKEANQ